MHRNTLLRIITVTAPNHFADDGKFKGILQNKTVLLVDDDMRNIYSLTTILENENVSVICAYDGAEAMEKLKQNPAVDIILMDIMMPVMDGNEAIQLIKKIDRFKNTPIIAITAKAMLGDREKSLAAGASDYITKPVNAERLISVMKALVYK